MVVIEVMNDGRGSGSDTDGSPCCQRAEGAGGERRDISRGMADNACIALLLSGIPHADYRRVASAAIAVKHASEEERQRAAQALEQRRSELQQYVAAAEQEQQEKLLLERRIRAMESKVSRVAREAPRRGLASALCTVLLGCYSDTS